MNKSMPDCPQCGTEDGNHVEESSFPKHGSHWCSACMEAFTPMKAGELLASMPSRGYPAASAIWFVENRGAIERILRDYTAMHSRLAAAEQREKGLRDLLRSADECCRLIPPPASDCYTNWLQADIAEALAQLRGNEPASYRIQQSDDQSSGNTKTPP